jgi:hypothetical protein
LTYWQNIQLTEPFLRGSLAAWYNPSTFIVVAIKPLSKSTSGGLMELNEISFDKIGIETTDEPVVDEGVASWR